MHISLDGLKVGRCSSLELQPIITDGMQQVLLPKVMVKGRRNLKEYQRQLACMSKRQRQACQEPYAIYEAQHLPHVIEYSTTVRYEDWMKQARLQISTETCRCGNHHQQGNQEVCARLKKDHLEPGDLLLAYRQPQAESVKTREVEQEFHLQFPRSVTDLQPALGTNEAELARIRQMADIVGKDKDVVLRHLEVSGYASPEGDEQNNKTLSEGRAKALVEYICLYAGFSPALCETTFGGENWAGLEDAVRESSLESKAEILQILESQSDKTARESALKRLQNGRVYNQLLQTIYPNLRKAVCRISYEVRPFQVSEVRDIIHVSPQKLSLNEMFLLATTYEAGSDDFNDVMQTAVRMFPDNETANLNAANAALEIGDVRTAERYLDKAGSSAEALNAQGVCLMWKGQTAQAADKFRLAMEQGLTTAKTNLEMTR